MTNYTINDGITQSLLTDWDACRPRARMILEGWRSIQPRYALDFGTMWHGILEENYKLLREEQCIWEWEEHEIEWREKLAGRVSDKLQFEKFITMAQALYEVYVEFWQDDYEREWEEVEGKFDLDWRGYRLRGMRDGKYSIKPTKQTTGHWLLENKTASGISPMTLGLQLNLNFQNLFYITTAEEEYDVEFDGVLYNVVVKPAHKFNGDVQDYYERISKAINDNPKKYFHRFEVKYSKRQKEAFKKELKLMLTDFFYWLVDGDKTTDYKSRGSCVGKWACEFLPACASGTMAGYLQDRVLFEELGGV